MESHRWFLILYAMSKGFRKTEMGSWPHTMEDGKEGREGRSPLFIMSPQPLASSGTLWWHPNDQAHAGRTILSGMKPPESRLGHTSQKHCDPDGLPVHHTWRITGGFKDCSQQNKVLLIRVPRAGCFWPWFPMKISHGFTGLCCDCMSLPQNCWR